MSAARAWLALVLLSATAAAPAPAPAREPSPSLEAAARMLRAGDPQAARAAYRALAQAGEPLAQQAMAKMLLDGIGGPADRAGAMRWLCRLAHQRGGGPDVMRAAWYLAEYFRTGGGVPGARYNDGERAAENPIKAYFWFGIMAGQARYFERVEERARTLGEVGMSEVGRQLRDGERQQLARALQDWRPAHAPATGEACLALPGP